MVSSESEWGRFLHPEQAEECRSPYSQSFSGCDVVITGAAGSIGSALAFALAHGGTRRLLLVDQSEGSLFELRRRFTFSSAEFHLASAEHFPLSELRDPVVFHAAAYKHLGLLESNPQAAIRNNTALTYRVLQHIKQLERCSFLLVSTDKAAAPTSIMGASKRAAELITLASHNKGCQTAVVRLCNVIGSTGSVVPIFQEQVRAGRPVTLTHPDARRYFVTLSQAIDLILQTASHCQGQLVLPDPGPSVSIAELAHAFTSNVEITGLQRGEKLEEILSSPLETQVRSDQLASALSRLTKAETRAEIVSELQALLPEYQPA